MHTSPRLSSSSSLLGACCACCAWLDDVAAAAAELEALGSALPCAACTLQGLVSILCKGCNLFNSGERMIEAAVHKQTADSKAHKDLRVGHLDLNRVGRGHP